MTMGDASKLICNDLPDANGGVSVGSVENIFHILFMGGNTNLPRNADAGRTVALAAPGHVPPGQFGF